MYLSRLTLNVRDRFVRQDLADCHSFHRRLLLAFGPVPAGGKGARAQLGLLYRLDERAGGAAHVLIQSRVEPDWSALPEHYVLPAGRGRDEPACKAIDDFYAALAAGMALRFRLRANPTRRIAGKNEGEDKRWHGKRVELRGEEQWLGWLARQGEQHGFALVESRARPGAPDVRVADQGKLEGRRGVGEGSRLTLAVVLFDGYLRVDDVERFRLALAAGIGSGKAYGCGLLSVARVA